MEEYTIKLGYITIELSIVDDEIEVYICNSQGNPIILNKEETDIFMIGYNNFKKINNK